MYYIVRSHIESRIYHLYADCGHMRQHGGAAQEVGEDELILRNIRKLCRRCAKKRRRQSV